MKSVNSYTPKASDINQGWHLIDARGRILGKVAEEVAVLLMGKNKPTFSTHINMGDKVVVINAEEIAVTGNKKESKTYYRHTGYPGGIRSETLGKLLNRRPTEALRKAVSGMLPKNKLRSERIANLYIYAGNEHPHNAQVK